MPKCIWTTSTTQPYLQKPEMAAKSIGTAENWWWDKFHYWFKIQDECMTL